MLKTRRLRYVLFTLLFAFVLLGLILRSYPLLIVMAIAAVILGVVGEKIENAPTEPFKKYNEKHHHVHWDE